MATDAAKLTIVIITGLSGAGKTTAIQSLEDLGYYTIDNLPPTLIPKFTELCAQSESKIDKVALVIDIRGGHFFDTLAESLNALAAQRIAHEILFLEADDSVLVRRFKESRRLHPLAPQGSVLEGITLERQLLENLRGRAHKVIDTSGMTSRELKRQITELFSSRSATPRLTITLVSFGYKYGTPLDADLVMDVRFLPNPFYHAEMRELTGLDEAVKRFVMDNRATQAFLKRYLGMLKYLLPFYIREGKTHLGIALGCTGGQHRSVVLVEELGEQLTALGYRVLIKHRDLPRRQGAGETL